MSLPAGTRLGRYQIRSPIGAGGMGEVYLAEDVRLGRLVALKILPAAFVDSRERLLRFEQEARAASALNHPNILTIHEIDEDHGTHFIATEFIEGVTLRQLMHARQINLSETLDIALQLTSALASAHASGIIHRDIKPENVMVRSDRLVKVLDFGLVKLTEAYGPDSSEDPTLIKSNLGAVKGTIAYMSPEQARGLTVDERTDVWSLGCLLYEMLARRTAFAGASTTDLLISIIQEEPQPLQTYVPGVPAELAWMIARMMRKSRDERYQSINEVRADLRRFSQRFNLDEELAGTRLFGESRGRAQAGTNETSYRAGVGVALDEAVFALSQERHPHNLSEELTPFVGRREEMAAIEEMLRRTEVRLVTLTGCCGTGKTRLAQMVARRLLREFTDGAFFIDLAPLTDAELVAPAIAQPLGVQESGSKPLSERLKEFLKDKRMLIVLDNFERLMGAVSLVKELLSAAPALKMLVTSRVPLHLNAEHEFSVPPLQLPSTGQMPSTGSLMQYEAIALFVGRAQAVKPAFRLTERNASSVAEICKRLDGLPLAIELAATRVKLLSPQSILKRLQNRLRLLTGGARDLPARQRTMRGAISWSYDLLEEEERKLLNRLSVFAGGCTLDAAEKVCAADGDLQLEMLDAVAPLVDKSLLVQQEQADGEPRFRMLEVVRSYALEALEARGELEAMRRLHAGYFLAIAEEAEQALLGERSTWLDRLEVEHDNLWAALQWSTECDAETALRLTGSLQVFWLIRGHLTAARKWTETVLERSHNAPPSSARWKTLFGAGHLAQRQGDYPAARKFYDKSLVVAIEIGDRRPLALSNWGLGALACLQGDLISSRAFLDESLTISRGLDDKEIIGMSLNVLGELERTQRNYKAARTLYEEALALRRQICDEAGLCATLTNLGAVAYFEGDYEVARLYYREALAVGQELRHKSAIAHALDGVAALATRRGEAESAGQLAGAADRLHESIGFRESVTVDRLFRDAYLATLRNATSDEAFTAAYERGRALQMDDAIALALRESTVDGRDEK